MALFSILFKAAVWVIAIILIEILTPVLALVAEYNSRSRKRGDTTENGNEKGGGKWT